MNNLKMYLRTQARNCFLHIMRLFKEPQPGIHILNGHQYVFAQSVYKKYFSFDGKVINRRHFEPFWPISHMYYFLGCNKKYEE